MYNSVLYRFGRREYYRAPIVIWTSAQILRMPSFWLHYKGVKNSSCEFLTKTIPPTKARQYTNASPYMYLLSSCIFWWGLLAFLACVICLCTWDYCGANWGYIQVHEPYSNNSTNPSHIYVSSLLRGQTWSTPICTLISIFISLYRCHPFKDTQKQRGDTLEEQGPFHLLVST